MTQVDDLLASMACTQLVLILLYSSSLASLLASSFGAPPLLLPLPPLGLYEGPPRSPDPCHLPLLGGVHGRVGGDVDPRLLLVDLLPYVVDIALRLLDPPAQMTFPCPVA